ncbi:39S ribosomal protein L22, mitochondrial isoform X2 [Monodelphis domestica]|uniref:39S ribosomal protein L22, mitochondrial isoform X2 n=1 Tax=Monodelphis domestica TaxID=13616 RepID=UPI0024E1BA3A|nr:39S ribosomal protein L22, mitochondrial isoform X2 [Monodelphis domestica]
MAAPVLRGLGSAWLRSLRSQGACDLGLLSSNNVLPLPYIHTSASLDISRKWEKKNKIVYPPQLPGEPRRPAIRGMSIDQAVAQMEFSDKKGAKIIKEVLLEAQDMAVRDHNVEFRSNLYIVLPLDVDSVLSHKSLRIVLDHCIAASREVHCIAASREVHYIQLYHSVYQSLCTVSSWVCSFYSVSSIPIEFFQFIILLSTIVFYHQQKPQFVSQSKGIPSFSNFLPLQRAVTINIFV